MITNQCLKKNIYILEFRFLFPKIKYMIIALSKDFYDNLLAMTRSRSNLMEQEQGFENT